MCNKRMRPIKTTVNIHCYNRELSTHCTASTCLQPTCRIISATWECLYSTLWSSFGTGTVRLRVPSKSRGLATRRLFFHGFSASDGRFDHSSMTYKLEFLRNHWVHSLMATCMMCSINWTYWQWAGPKFHALLNAHHLISAYFITTESDKCMCLLTRLYGNCSHAGQVHSRD